MEAKGESSAPAAGADPMHFFATTPSDASNTTSALNTKNSSSSGGGISSGVAPLPALFASPNPLRRRGYPLCSPVGCAAVVEHDPLSVARYVCHKTGCLNGHKKQEISFVPS